MQSMEGDDDMSAAPCVDSTPVILPTVCMPNVSLTETQLRQVPCDLSQKDLLTRFHAKCYQARQPKTPPRVF